MHLHISEVRDPEAFLRRRDNVTINEVARSVLVLVTDLGQLELAAPPNTRQFLDLHESPHVAVCDLDVLAVQPRPDLLRAVDAIEVGLMHAQNFGLRHGPGERRRRAKRWRCR